MTRRSLIRLGLAPLIAATWLVSCASDPISVPDRTQRSDAAVPSDPESEQTAPPDTLAARERWLDDDTRLRVDHLISTFENSTTEIRYDYAENIGDGRGVTSGRAGFTTATCDALAVIDLYTSEQPDNVLAGFVDELTHLCDEESDDTEGLPEDAYIAAWQEAAQDPSFRDAQDRIVDLEYFEPAMTLADELGLETPLARAQLYDTAIQHGVGDDPDGLPAIAGRTSEQVGSPEDAGEEAWLAAFFAERLGTLDNPANEATQEGWRQSVSRVECMQSIAADGNFDLDPPISCVVYGDPFTIE